MSEPNASAEPVVYQLRIVLHGISRLIWRRLLVRSDGTIADLHRTLQVAFGCSNEHVRRFVIHGREHGAESLTTLVSPVVHEMVRCMEPISPVYSSRATRNRWRHYERLRRPLGGFIAIADAARSYNPRFAQGMSTAAVCARILEHCLVEYSVANRRLPARFFSAQARFQATPWLFAAGDDLRFPVTVGKRSLSVRLYNWYRLNAVRCPDRRVGARLAEVTQLVRPRSALFAPQMISSVARATIQRRIDQFAGQRSSNGIALMPPGVQ